jgi:hypothetical protein
MPVTVRFDIMLATSETAAICVTHASAYSSGWVVSLTIVRSGGEHLSDPLLFNPHGVHGSSDGEEKALRFGIGFSDDRYVMSRPGESLEIRDGEVAMGMRLTRGGGDCLRWVDEYWAWPIPPPGEMRFVCEWKAAKIERCEARLDAAKLRRASKRAITVF